MWKIEREVELKWQQATIKNDLIFTWLFFENKKLTLRLLQIILPELNIKKVGDTQRENAGDGAAREIHLREADAAHTAAFHQARLKVFADHKLRRTAADVDHQLAPFFRLGVLKR